MKRLMLLLLFGVLLTTLASAETIHYNFNNSLNDSSGNTLNLNSTGFFETGKLNQALRVNDTFVSAVGNQFINFSNGNFSIAFWMNTTNTTQSGVLGTNAILGPDTGTFSVRINRAGRTNGITFLGSSPTVEFHSKNTTALNDGNWHHIVYTRNFNNLSVYIDGVIQNSTTFTNNLSVTQFGFKVGEIAPFGGLMDDLRVFKGLSLTQAEIDNIYNAGTGDEIPIQKIVLNSPANSQMSSSSNVVFNSSVTMLGTQINATLFIWDQGGTIVNRTTNNLTGTKILNTTTWTVNNLNLLGNYSWNVLACGNYTTDILCSFRDSNNSFVVGNFEEEFAPTLIEGQSTAINLNITFDGLDSNLLALLIWNNTQSVPSKSIINSSRIRFTSNFVVPVGTGNSSGVDITHYWRFYLPDGSLNGTTSDQQQTVFSLGFDNCTAFSSLLLNYTMYDEDSITLINGSSQNASIELDLTATSLADPDEQTNFSRTYSSTNNAQVCVSTVASGFRIDAQAKYTASNYVVEFHNIQNASLSASSFPQHIGLYPLLSSRSQEFLITYKDENFVPVENALITVTRKYVGEGLFRTVEAPLTNEDGQALVHLVLGDEIYTIQVSKNGVILGIFDNIVPFCTNIATGECTINLNSFTSGTQPNDFATKNNLSYFFTLNKTARTISSTFTTTDGSVALINLTSLVFDNRGNNTACSSSVQTSSGTLICTIPASIGNTTIRAILYKDGNYIDQVIFSLTESEDTGFGYTGIFMLLILYITIPLMMVSSGAGIVIGAILGMVFGGMLHLFEGGSIIGTTSTIIWFIIAGAVILYKINRERSG